MSTVAIIDYNTVVNTFEATNTVVTTGTTGPIGPKGPKGDPWPSDSVRIASEAAKEAAEIEAASAAASAQIASQKALEAFTIAQQISGALNIDGGYSNSLYGGTAPLDCGGAQ